MNTNNAEVMRALICMGYQLGLRVAADILEVDLSTHSDAILDHIERIESGAWTPVPSGAEIRSLYPDEPDIEGARRRDQEAMRVAAKMILQWYREQGGLAGA